MQEFADWLRKARGKSGLSQDALSEACRGVDPKCAIYQARITAWENAKDAPSFRQLALVCRVLGLGPREARAGRKLWERAQLSDLPAEEQEPSPVLLEDETSFSDQPTLS